MERKIEITISDDSKMNYSVEGLSLEEVIFWLETTKVSMIQDVSTPPQEVK